MSSHTEEVQKSGVKGWWNSDNILKWDREYDNYDEHTMAYLNTRQQVVLEFLEGLNLPKGAKVLELGYGAGQTACKMGQMGFEVHGIDISEKLCNISKQRCEQYCSESKFDFRVGSIEEKFPYENETFDVVVVVGALQYLYHMDICLKETNRVLKKGGHFIVAQRNGYSLSNYGSFRDFCRSITHFILREPHELFSSFRSILCDSRLGCIFKRWEDTKFFNTKFMLKGHDFYKFPLKRNLSSFFTLKKQLKNQGFQTVKADGAYYAVTEKKSGWDFNVKADKKISQWAKQPLNKWMFVLARTVILLAQKTNEDSSSN